MKVFGQHPELKVWGLRLQGLGIWGFKFRKVGFASLLLGGLGIWCFGASGCVFLVCS